MITIKAFEFNYFQENTYLLYDDTGEAVLIDCGCCRKEEQEELKKFIYDNNLKLKHLLCTHLHLDHILGNEFIYNTYGLSPEASKLDVEALPSLTDQARMFNLPINEKDISVGKYLVGGEIVRFGKSELKVLTVPGHSPGGLAFYNEKNGFVIVGDSLFANSIGRTDLWGGNQELLIAAIRDKLLSLPDDTLVYPGHGPATSINNEKYDNPYL